MRTTCTRAERKRVHPGVKGSVLSSTAVGELGGGGGESTMIPTMVEKENTLLLMLMLMLMMMMMIEGNR